ncbi:MAG: ABC transporter permease [Clostridia bacterium]|nr:ABC transporter permease [Clostridia bacterium]
MFEAFIDSQPGSIALGIIWGIMAIGVYITYKVLDIADLTVDGSFSTGGAVLVVCVTSGMNIWLAMLLAFISGCLAGLVTAIFHTKFGIPAILAGILTQLALYSINLRILGGMANLPISFRKYNLLLTLSDIPKSLIMGGIFTVALIAILYWFFGTEIGHSLRATGCNQTMSRANGVNTNVAKTIGIVLSNGIVALSGALLAQYNGYADINMGRGAIVIGLAAVIIGEVVFGKIFRNFALKLLSVVIGGVAYYFFINLVLTLGLPANDLKLLQAVIVAVFLGIPYWKNSITKGKHKIKKENKGGVINA